MARWTLRIMDAVRAAPPQARAKLVIRLQFSDLGASRGPRIPPACSRWRAAGSVRRTDRSLHRTPHASADRERARAVAGADRPGAGRPLRDTRAYTLRTTDDTHARFAA